MLVRAVAVELAPHRIRCTALLPGWTDTDMTSPDGAFYLWIDAREWCAALGGDSEALCYDLLENEGLALVPGSAFGVEGYVRLSFAAADPVLEDAVVRLASAGERILGERR